MEEHLILGIIINSELFKKTYQKKLPSFTGRVKGAETGWIGEGLGFSVSKDSLYATFNSDRSLETKKDLFKKVFTVSKEMEKAYTKSPMKECFKAFLINKIDQEQTRVKKSWNNFDDFMSELEKEIGEQA